MQFIIFFKKMNILSLEFCMAVIKGIDKLMEDINGGH